MKESGIESGRKSKLGETGQWFHTNRGKR